MILRQLAAPTSDRPTVRCIGRADALALIRDARDVLDDPEIRHEPAESLLEALVTSGLLVKLELEGGVRPATLFAIGPQAPATLAPIELLEAAHPNGVICYFTALEFYGLTTQMASFHHIARLVPRPRQSGRTAIDRSPPTEAPALRRRHALGTLLFSYRDQPYFRTDRSAHTVPGIQLRQLNDKTLARITTREQTLLDTLQHPARCGGSSIVWEAWKRGVENVDPNRLFDHLRDIDDLRLMRRVGHVLQQLGHDPSDPLAALLATARRRVAARTDDDVIPLFLGIPGTQLDSIWNVQFP